MNKIRAGLALVSGMAVSAVAMPTFADTLSEATRNWSGMYGGVSVDGAFSGHSASTDIAGVYGGYIDPAFTATWGHNWQRGNLVFGLEGSVTSPGAEGVVDWDSESFLQNRYEWGLSAALRGRAGVTVNNMLLYGAMGVRFADVKLDACEQGRFETACATNDYSTHVDGVQEGLTAAIGAEFALSKRLTSFAEYQISSFGARYSRTNRTGETTELTPHTINRGELRFGLNYAFTDNSDTPVAAPVLGRGTWDGGYIGLNYALGMLTNHSGHDDGGTRTTVQDNAAGVQIGVNWQRGAFVYGVEGDWTNSMYSHKSWGDEEYASSHNWNWTSTVRMRAGISTGSALIYATGGVALAKMDLDSCEGASCQSASSTSNVPWSGTNVGFAAGFGAQLALSERMALRAEYLYIGFPMQIGTDISGNSTPHAADANLLRFGVDYTFNPGSSAPADPLHDWSGNYFGLFGTGGTIAGAGGGELGNTSIVGKSTGIGVAFGRNWQRGNVVFGFEADVQKHSGRQEAYFYTPDSKLSSVEWNWSGTLRGRAGIATGRALFYATGGLAVADTKIWHCFSTSLGCHDPNNLQLPHDTYFEGVQTGLTGGFGIAYAMTEDLSLVTEYQATLFSAQRGTSQPNDVYFSDHTTWSHLLKLGVNYAF